MTFKLIKDNFSLKYLYFVIFAIFIAFPASNAWTYENNKISYENSVSREALRIKPSISSIANDACKHLLKVNNTTSPVTSVTSPNQRKAGKVAALAVVLGVRFAIEPNNKAKNIDRSALAIANFRKCHKENTLNIMASAY